MSGSLADKSTSAIADLSLNSPYVIELSFLKEFNYSVSLSTSAYYSKSSGTMIEQDGTRVDFGIPVEYGLTGYFNYRLDSKYIMPILYAGLDFEQFVSFDPDGITSMESLSMRLHKLLYMTIGVSHNFLFFKKRTIIKASISKSIASSQSNASLQIPRTFVGSKVLLFLNLQLLKQWSVHMFLKRHNLIGATQLIATRMGFGIGYAF